MDANEYKAWVPINEVIDNLESACMRYGRGDSSRAPVVTAHQAVRDAITTFAKATVTGPERDLRDLERLAQRYECVTVELGTLNLSVWRGKPAGYDEALWQCREHGHGLSSRSRAEDVAKIKIKCLLPEGSEGGKE